VNAKEVTVAQAIGGATVTNGTCVFQAEGGEVRVAWRQYSAGGNNTHLSAIGPFERCRRTCELGKDQITKKFYQVFQSRLCHVGDGGSQKMPGLYCSQSRTKGP
jgi:hypothetical protein